MAQFADQPTEDDMIWQPRRRMESDVFQGHPRGSVQQESETKVIERRQIMYEEYIHICEEPILELQPRTSN